MEDLPGDVHVDAQVVVDHLRALAAAPSSTPRTWLPQATFDALQIRADREPIHLNLALHHLHQKWNMDATRPLPEGTGWQTSLKRTVAKFVDHHLHRYFVEEQDFRAATAQSIDALAYRIDEVSTSDFRALLDLVRADLADLARHVDEQIDARLAEHPPPGDPAR
ncbi:MAG: hypothetical protein M0T71_00845 [Actinomycetota bacterium]|jgi:hypothetical protein|nr:hypothetical protein [Actinomycetota bacterium]